MKRIYYVCGVCIFMFLGQALYADEVTTKESAKDQQEIVKESEGQNQSPEAKQETETKSVDQSEAQTGDKQALGQDQQPKEDNSQGEEEGGVEEVEEVEEEVEEPVVYKKEEEIGLRFRFGYGMTKLSTNMEYSSYQQKSDNGSNANFQTYFTVDSDTYLGFANFMFQLLYRPVDLPLDLGVSFMMERFKESYPLYRGSLNPTSESGVTVRDVEYANDSYNVKTRMQKVSIDIMYSFPEFVVIPYIAFNIYPWYHTTVKGFNIPWSEVVQDSGKIKAKSDIGYGGTVGVAYNVVKNLSVFAQLSFEKNVSKITLDSNSGGDSDTERFELDHKITKILLGIGYSL